MFLLCRVLPPGEPADEDEAVFRSSNDDRSAGNGVMCGLCGLGDDGNVDAERGWGDPVLGVAAALPSKLSLEVKLPALEVVLPSAGL